jgi:hypothetical protein
MSYWTNSALLLFFAAGCFALMVYQRLNHVLVKQGRKKQLYRY